MQRCLVNVSIFVVVQFSFIAARSSSGIPGIMMDVGMGVVGGVGVGWSSEQNKVPVLGRIRL